MKMIEEKRAKVTKKTFLKIVNNNWNHKGNEVVYFSFNSTRGGSVGMKPKHWENSYYSEIAGLVDIGVETPAIKMAKKIHERKMEKEYKRRAAIESEYTETFAYKKTVVEEGQVYQNIARVGIDVTNKIKCFSPIHGDIITHSYMELTQEEVDREIKNYNNMTRA